MTTELKHFSATAKPDGVLEVSGDLSREQVTSLTEAWKALHGDPETSAHFLDMQAVEFGLARDWRTSLEDRQRLVIALLQNRLRSEIEPHKGAGLVVKSGEVKDLAIALGVAVDKLEVLLGTE